MGALRARFEIQYSSAYCAARARARRYFVRAKIGFCLAAMARFMCGLTRMGRSTRAAGLRVCGCVGESLCRRCVWVGRVVSSIVRSTAVRYCTVTSERRFFRPVGATGWQPHSFQGNGAEASGCLGRRHGDRAPCAKRVREGGAGASQYTWSAVAVPSLMPFAAALEPDRHLSEMDKGGAESLRSPTRSSAPGVLEEHLAHAVLMRNGARPAGRPRDVACRPRPAGRESWRVVLRPRGA